MRRGAKIIQLIRDPRATIVSRGSYNSTTVTSITNYCQLRMADLAYVKDLYRLYHAQLTEIIYYLRYEDLATKPVPVMASIYEFLGIEPDDNVKDWAAGVAEKNLNALRNIPNGSSKSETRYSTSRSNPALTAHAWRQTIPMDVMEYIQASCGDFLDTFGYTFFKDELDLRNLERSAIQEIQTKQIFTALESDEFDNRHDHD